MNILIVEMLDLVKIEDCLEIAGIRTNRIIEYNENVLDKYCANYENSKYTTLQKLIDVTIYEKNKIIGDKISGINTLLYMLFQVDCNEINNLFDYSDEELNIIDPNTLEETIGVSTAPTFFSTGNINIFFRRNNRSFNRGIYWGHLI